MKFLFLLSLSLSMHNAWSMGGTKPQPSVELREKDRPDLVAAWYHHWWYKGRFDAAHKNHRYEPQLGHYVMDEKTVKQHVEWAKYSGINALIMNFWLEDHDWWWVEKHSDLVAPIMEAEGLKYFFLFDRDLSNGGWMKYQPSDIARRVVTRAKKYFSRPGYIKVNAKPVVFFWAMYQTTCEFWSQVRVGIEKELGPIFLTGDLDCLDMQFDYNPYTAKSSDYQVQLDRQDKMWRDRAKKKKAWAPTALAGYDDTKVRSGNPPVLLNPDFFQKSIQTALKYKQYHSDGKSWLFINSWNEWHEGSQIEPMQLEASNPHMKDPMSLLNVLKKEMEALAPSKGPSSINLHEKVQVPEEMQDKVGEP